MWVIASRNFPKRRDRRRPDYHPISEQAFLELERDRTHACRTRHRLAGKVGDYLTFRRRCNGPQQDDEITLVPLAALAGAPLAPLNRKLRTKVSSILINQMLRRANNLGGFGYSFLFHVEALSYSA